MSLNKEERTEYQKKEPIVLYFMVCQILAVSPLLTYYMIQMTILYGMIVKLNLKSVKYILVRYIILPVIVIL